MTQEELAENICDPVTLARYESGKLNPSDEKFCLLMQKMGMSGEQYVIPVQNAKASHETQMKNILHALEREDFEEVEKNINFLKKDSTFLMENIENKQYIKRLELMINYEMGEIEAGEYIESLETILKWTFKDYDENYFPIHRVFTENEVLIISNIARQYAQMGKTELAIHLYYNLEDYFQTDVVINDYKPRYIELLSLSNLLGLSKRYDESIKICKRGIQWLLKYDKSNYLYNFYYNIGWIINKKIQGGMENPEAMKQAKCYIWLAYQLCQIYPENKENANHILKFYKDSFKSISEEGLNCNKLKEEEEYPKKYKN